MNCLNPIRAIHAAIFPSLTPAEATKKSSASLTERIKKVALETIANMRTSLDQFRKNNNRHLV